MNYFRKYLCVDRTLLKSVKIPLLVLFCILYFAFNSYTQNYFNNRYDFYNYCDGASSILPIDSGYICVGRVDVEGTCSTGSFAIMRLDSIGNVKYKKSYGASNMDYYVGFGSLIKITDSTFAACGSVQNTSGNSDVMLYKFNIQGDTLWTKSYGSTAFEASYQCKHTIDGGYAIAGASGSTGNDNMLLIKTDSNGNMQWQKQYGSGNTEYGCTLDITSDSGYVVGGYTQSGSTYMSSLVRTDNVGNMKWQKSFSNDVSAVVVATPDNGCIVATSWSDSIVNPYSYNRLYVLKYNSAGSIIWQNKYGNARYGCYPWMINKTNNGNFIITGNTTASDTESAPGNHIVGFAAKIDGSGNKFWYRQYDILKHSENYLRDIKNTNDGGYIACGFIIPSTPDTGTQDMWVIKLDSCGCDNALCDSTCGATGINELSGKSLLKIFPNPSNDLVTFLFTTTINKTFSLSIYDMFGREQKNIVFENNSFSKTFSVTNFAPGIYECIVRDNNFSVAQKKLIIIH